MTEMPILDCIQVTEGSGSQSRLPGVRADGHQRWQKITCPIIFPRIGREAVRDLTYAIDRSRALSWKQTMTNCWPSLRCRFVQGSIPTFPSTNATVPSTYSVMTIRNGDRSGRAG